VEKYTMADANFKESFGVMQLFGFIAVFTGLLCLVPILRWTQILG
jgi:hypothetical protein